MPREYIKVKPEMLTWAITRAGFDVDKYLENAPNVREWIEGTKQPTVKQLEDFARKVYIPYGFLFMDKQLDEKCPIPFFRTKDKAAHFNLNVYDVVITMQNRQHWLSEYLSANDFDKPSYIGAYTKERSVPRMVAAIRELLQMPVDWAFGYQTTEAATNELVGHLESLGCVVMFQGMVGNQSRRKIAVSDCRGFTLVDAYAPCIFVNSNDAAPAKLFTLVHEFVHILTGDSVGSGSEENQETDNELEQFCDSVAAAFLMDETLFREVWKEKNGDFKKVARPFKVSGLAVAHRAKVLGLIADDQFFAYLNWLKSLPVANRQQSSGGNFYATAKKRLGYSFLVHVRNAINSNQLLYRDAYALTGYSGNTFNKLINEHL